MLLLEQNNLIHLTFMAKRTRCDNPGHTILHCVSLHNSKSIQRIYTFFAFTALLMRLYDVIVGRLHRNRRAFTT